MAKLKSKSNFIFHNKIHTLGTKDNPTGTGKFQSGKRRPQRDTLLVWANGTQKETKSIWFGQTYSWVLARLFESSSNRKLGKEDLSEIMWIKNLMELKCVFMKIMVLNKNANLKK